MRLIVGNVHDEIQTRRLAEAEAQHLAYHDPLTGQPNRSFLKKVMAEGPPFEVKGVLAALSADLDHFKSVNDALGHVAGDELLRRTVETIRTAVGKDAFLSRVSGDEFIVLLDGKNWDAVEAIAARLVTETSEPLVLRGHTLSIGLSIGVAFAQAGDHDLSALVRRADLALYEAKKAGRKRFVTFSDDMQINADRRRQIEQDLDRALKTGADRRPLPAHPPRLRQRDDRRRGAGALEASRAWARSARSSSSASPRRPGRFSRSASTF